jgi:hypothetical protein
MAQYKYNAGQRVSVSRGAGAAFPGGSYRVVGALPSGDGPQQYRIRNEAEMFDRVIDETRLEAVEY